MRGKRTGLHGRSGGGRRDDIAVRAEGGELADILCGSRQITLHVDDIPSGESFRTDSFADCSMQPGANETPPFQSRRCRVTESSGTESVRRWRTGPLVEAVAATRTVNCPASLSQFSKILLTNMCVTGSCCHKTRATEPQPKRAEHSTSWQGVADRLRTISCLYFGSPIKFVFSSTILVTFCTLVLCLPQ